MAELQLTQAQIDAERRGEAVPVAINGPAVWSVPQPPPADPPDDDDPGEVDHLAEPDDVRADREALTEQHAATNEHQTDTRPTYAEPIDWHELFATDEQDEDWIVYPLLPERRHVAIYSPPKAGKSLLMLEMAVAVSRGAKALGEATRQHRVLYVDFENDPRGDIRTRLEAMGHGPADLANLVYLSFPDLAALNTPAGGQQLAAHAEHYQCGLVVVDTVSRAVVGEENSNDTWLGFYAHTGLRLKRAGIAMIRLDHTGKDQTRGMRGGSAKAGDVDAVWSLSKVSDDTFTLECTDHRFVLIEDRLTVHRHTDPLRHTVAADAWRTERDARIGTLIGHLDRLQIPADHGRTKVRERLKQEGVKATNADLTEAIRKRQNLARIGLGGPAEETS